MKMGFDPVIATVVIVATVIGIAIAVTYWMGGLAIFTIDVDPTSTKYSRTVYLGDWINGDLYFHGIYEGYFVIGHITYRGASNIYISVEHKEFRLENIEVRVLEYSHDYLVIEYWEV